jgi:hypothetical protein
LEDALSTYGTATANGPSSAGEAPQDSTAQQAKDKAQETAHQAAGEAKGRVRDQVDQRSTDAGQRVSGVAQDVRSVGEELRKQGKDQPAKLAEQAAQRAESLGDYLQRSDGETILGDLEDFGRRQPWAVIAGGVVLGLAASRFLKASSDRRYASRSQSSAHRLPARREDVAPTAVGGEITTTGGIVGGDLGAAGETLPGRDPRV